jgi:glycosyltransferase involved in cell wall biosynthesis
MKIGIDISQLAFENTGISSYLGDFVQALIKTDNRNDYVLFFSSMRKSFPQGLKLSDRVKIKTFKFPPTLLDLLWNKLHILPIENFIGPVDIFITSDWTEPPVKHAKKLTILYDLIVYKYPEETHRKIVNVQKRKLQWVKKETDKILCISKSTAEDAQSILNINKDKLAVIYPGI